MYKQNLIHNTVTDNAGDAGGGAPPKDQQDSKADASQVKAQGDQYDDFGYKILPKPEGDKDSKAGEKEEAKPEEKLEDIKDPASGYGVKALEEPKEDPVSKIDQPATVDENKPADIDVKGLDDKEAEKLKEFAKTNSLSKEQAQKLVDLRKSEFAQSKQAQIDAQKQQEREVAKLKAGWDKELRADPSFGGAHFEKSLVKVEKVLNQFMPGTKKILTEGKITLHPGIMRDLAKIADIMYRPENLVNGEASGARSDKKSEEKESSPLDFYNS